ncbi:site-specific integrase [Flavobacterium psychrophilum]|uniref:hypothetical protein n=1 Tax=Flavobacterium psychrophilum TaxID=96345 RepID=UPI000A82111E|nr:hypothetical protein [Flavobacterium psychrophilum]
MIYAIYPTRQDFYKLVLGYFLFSCMTGLRVSNIQKLNRDQLMQNDMKGRNVTNAFIS